VVEIDGDAPENAECQQSLTNGEEIEVLLVPLEKLLVELDKQSRDQDVMVDSMVYAFALGHVLGGNTAGGGNGF